MTAVCHCGCKDRCRDRVPNSLVLFDLFKENRHILTTLNPKESSFEKGPKPVCLFFAQGLKRTTFVPKI